MEQTILTGDPFVDVGGLVMDSLPHKTTEDKIRFATNVYVDRWKGKLDSVFLHSKLNNNQVKNKPEEQRKGALLHYFGILQGKGAHSEGYCRICAHRGLLFKAGRDNFPLVGSGDFVNFHHFHGVGLLVCKSCLVKLYLLPFGVLQSGGMLMLLQVQDRYTAQFWLEFIVRDNLDRISRGSSETILKSSFLNPQNALFYFASRLIERFEQLDLPSQQLRLIRFNNFASKPDVAFYDLPKPVFSFLKRVLKPDLKTDWLHFVKRHYRIGKGAGYDEEAGEWVGTVKKESVMLDEQEYAGTRHNRVHDYLLSGKSILRLLCRMHRIRRFPVLISIVYLKEVRRMRQEQIDSIRDISNKIVALAQRDGDFKKLLTPIEGARYAHQLRTAILRMAKAHYKNGEPEPFVRLNDYVDYLFPDGQSWYEMRDLMLICLYEKLHDLRIAPTEVSDDAVSDIEDADQGSLDDLSQ